MDNATPAARNRALVKQIVDARKRQVNDERLADKQDREVAIENRKRQSKFRTSHGLLLAFLALIL